MNMYVIITSVLALFFLVIVAKAIYSKRQQQKIREAFNKQVIKEKELKQKGLKPFSFLIATNKPVKVWGRSYQEAAIQFQANKKGGMYAN